MTGDRGQMTVELAVLVPVVIVIALTVVNLLGFVDACSVFDRVALDAVVAQGVSPAGEQGDLSATQAVVDAIEGAVGRDGRCSVQVRVERLSESSGGTDLTLAPFLSRFVCVLEYRPWPSSFSIAGVTYQAPVVLRHERSIVVDRFRTGVVM